MLPKIDGILITKKRYLIPLSEKLTIELDIFEDALAPLVLAEVEFTSEEEANAFYTAGMVWGRSHLFYQISQQYPKSEKTLIF